MVEIASVIMLIAGVVLNGGLFPFVSGEEWFISYYGTEEDGYLGEHHGAYWHGDSCGLPTVVDEEHYGAAAPRGIPYCSQLVVCVPDRVPDCVTVTVVDRQRDDYVGGSPHIDLWPAPARMLGIYGPVGVDSGDVFLLRLGHGDL